MHHRCPGLGRGPILPAANARWPGSRPPSLFGRPRPEATTRQRRPRATHSAARTPPPTPRRRLMNPCSHATTFPGYKTTRLLPPLHPSLFSIHSHIITLGQTSRYIISFFFSFIFLASNSWNFLISLCLRLLESQDLLLCPRPSRSTAINYTTRTVDLNLAQHPFTTKKG